MTSTMRAAGLLMMACLAFATGGCRGGQRPLLQVQFCLTSQNGAYELAQAMKAIAREEGMDYLDWSDETSAQLRNLDDHAANVRQSFPIINVAVRDSNDIEGFGGGNIGFPSNQVGFGFTHGSDKQQSLAFARRVIARLRQKWDVKVVSGEVGMFPLKCESSLT